MFATARSKAAAIASQPPFVSTKRRTSSASARAPIRVKASSGVDLSVFNFDSGLEAGAIILLVRLVTLGGGKAALKQLEEQIARAKEKNIDIAICITRKIKVKTLGIS